jgi:hypothetical protein
MHLGSNILKAFSDNAAQLKKDFKGGAWGRTRSKIIGVVEAVDPKADSCKRRCSCG